MNFTIFCPDFRNMKLTHNNIVFIGDRFMLFLLEAEICTKSGLELMAINSYTHLC